MKTIAIKKGLDLPLSGAPSGEIKPLPSPSRVALDVSAHGNLRLALCKKEGESVALGEPLIVDRRNDLQRFGAPAAGKVVEVIRGDKRRILQVVIEKEGDALHPAEKLEGDLPTQMAKAGLLAHFRKRPCDLLPTPDQKPEAIFVKGVETAPFAAPSALEIAGHEEAYAEGLRLLSTLAPVHTVGAPGGATEHTVKGPHPAGNASVHIYHIDPVFNKERVIWTTDVSGVIAVGTYHLTGRPYTERIIGIGGAISGLYRAEAGHALAEMGLDWGDHRIISGDPLMGIEVGPKGYLGFSARAISVLPEGGEGELLHFCRPGISRYTATRTYLSRLFPKKRLLTTALHGEERAFVDAAIYDKVMPMRVPVMELVKAIMAEDYDLAAELGLLEVAPEDFALPTFICPSKIPMVDIVRKGLWDYAAQNF